MYEEKLKEFEEKIRRSHDLSERLSHLDAVDETASIESGGSFVSLKDVKIREKDTVDVS